MLVFISMVDQTQKSTSYLKEKVCTELVFVTKRKGKGVNFLLKINYASENGLDDHMAMTTGPYPLLQDKSTLTEGH